MKLHRFCLFLVLIMLPGLGRAELFGYAEARGFWLDGVSDSEDMKYITLERLRPTFTCDLELLPHTSLTVTPEIYFQQGRNHPEILETDDYLTVERLYIDSYFDKFDLRMGRQAVTWGSAQIWNPTDLFREVFLTDYWAERKGINAARVYVPLPGKFRLTAVAATGDTVGTDNRYGMKLGTTWHEADIAAVFMDDTVMDRLVWGIDLKGQFKIGYWVEGAYFSPKDRHLEDRLDEREESDLYLLMSGLDDIHGKGSYLKEHYEVVAGVDYSFALRKGLAVAAQYYHDSSGEKFIRDYDWLARFAFARYMLGQDYGSLSALLNWSEDVSAGLNAIVNLNDSTWLVTPNINVLLPHDLQMNAGANLTAGPPGEFRMGDDADRLTDDPLLEQSVEFFLPEVAENIYYIWLRWSF
jgi:hypothetical protein